MAQTEDPPPHRLLGAGLIVQPVALRAHRAG
jgi:hypothetical protein